MPMPNSGLVHPRFHDDIRGSAVAAAGGFPDTCTITRAAALDTGTTAADGASFVPAAPATIYTGVCRVQLDTGFSRGEVEKVGDDVTTLQRYRIGVPWDVDGLQTDDVLVVTASRDPQLVGRPLVVRSFAVDTFLIRRLVIAEDHPDRPTPEA